MSRRIDYMRAPDVARYLARGAGAILPVGPTEAHGRHLPLGTDYLIALATAELAAREADALVLPPVAYSWPGATKKLPGTLTLPVDLVQRLLVGIVAAAQAQGFSRVAMICAHGPDVLTATLAARQAYEELGIPVAVHHAVPGRGTTDREREAAKAPLAGDEQDPGSGETSRLLAALEILGLPASMVDQAAESTPAHLQPSNLVLSAPLHSNGAGFHIEELEHHIPTPRQASAAAGRPYLEAAAAAVARSLTGSAEVGRR